MTLQLPLHKISYLLTLSTYLSILLGLMFSCLDTSIVSTALVNISADLGHDELDAPWAILAYLLSYMSECRPFFFDLGAPQPVLGPADIDTLRSRRGLLKGQRCLRTSKHVRCRMDLLLRIFDWMCSVPDNDTVVCEPQQASPPINRRTGLTYRKDRLSCATGNRGLWAL